MKFKLGNEGVSEVIGTVLLLAIAISAFSVLAVYVFSNTGTTPSPHVNLVGYMDESYNAIVEHNGGDSLKLQNIRVIIWLGEEESHEFSFTKNMLQNYNHSISLGGNSMFYDTGNNKRWDVGDYIKIDCPTLFKDITQDIYHWQISVMVIDKESNSVIMSGILQQGILHTTPPVALFTYSPLSPK
ncbi:MAG: type IV pilin N-terminal domain-containing protein, partial [Thermoplasmata archaeon]|nr:type IV pilin N-terminal domain-containing protein [Thermoplasmata archaeon]